MQDLSRLTTAFYIASTLTFDRRTSTLDVIKISPRGYCYGVVDAMVIAKNASLDKTLPRPIYILGMIVHNKHVTDAFEEDGIYTLDGTNRLEILKQVEKGTVIFTAHGVSPEVRKAAEEKGLVTIDATCPDVTKTHDLIRKVKAEGYHVIYIGKKGHPEPEGAVGVAPEIVHLVETEEDVRNLDIQAEKLIVTNQTTMSSGTSTILWNQSKKSTRTWNTIRKSAWPHRFVKKLYQSRQKKRT